MADGARSANTGKLSDGFRFRKECFLKKGIARRLAQSARAIGPSFSLGLYPQARDGVRQNS
jgi:hypothetical protein